MAAEVGTQDFWLQSWFTVSQKWNVSGRGGGGWEIAGLFLEKKIASDIYM